MQLERSARYPRAANDPLDLSAIDADSLELADGSFENPLARLQALLRPARKASACNDSGSDIDG
jgi:hypothetical protein